jgi:hypothetical protein
MADSRTAKIATAAQFRFSLVSLAIFCIAGPVVAVNAPVVYAGESELCPPEMLGFSADAKFLLSYDVKTAGETFEVLLVDSTNYERIGRGESFEYWLDASATKTSSASLEKYKSPTSSGTYYIAIMTRDTSQPCMTVT